MEYRQLGRSGLKVSEISLGTWQNFGQRLDEAAAFAVLDNAVDLGINLIDTADVYSGGKAEEVTGRWLAGKNRAELVIATKARGRMGKGPNAEGLSRKHLFEACEASLRRLGTDYIDLYQCHHPDPATPQAETLGALTDLVRQGKVRYIGCSNYSADMIAEATGISDRRNLECFISLQPNYSMLVRTIERSEIPRCEKDGLGLIVYSPLAQGLLSDKYVGGDIPEGTRGAGNERFAQRLQEHLTRLQRLAAIAKGRDLTLSQLALAWILRQPVVSSCIVGASRPEQLQENAAANGVRLTGAELQQIAEILDGPTGG
jgi:aryl-alcohol dehydrogenase-like predicted oxidoreductase